MKNSSILLLSEKYKEVCNEFIINKNRMFLYLSSLSYSQENEEKIIRLLNIPVPSIKVKNDVIFIEGHIVKTKPLKRLWEVGFCVDRTTASFLAKIKIDMTGIAEDIKEKTKQTLIRKYPTEGFYKKRMLYLAEYYNNICVFLKNSNIQNIEYYREKFKSVSLPKLISISEDNLTAQILIDNTVYRIERSDLLRLPLSKKQEVYGFISAITAIMSGKKQLAVDYTAKQRRLPDGTYSGIAQMVKTKKESGICHEASKKTALARRQIDGSYKGTEKMLNTKRRLGIVPKNGRWGGKPCIFTKNSGEKITMRSSWEWYYAKLLEEQGFIWDYEPCVLQYENKKHVPDFFVEKIGYVEIKPSCFLSELPDGYIQKFNITVITEKTFNFNNAYKQAKPFFVEGFNG
jgi:hypothetical protein